MSEPRFAEAARAYWTALGRKEPLPELPEEPFDAFVELLHLGSEGDVAFELLDLGASPYPGLLVGDRSGPWARNWAIELAELEPFVLRGEPEILYLADSHPDPSGRHRVYTFEEGIRGLTEFRGVDDALLFMAAKLESRRTGKELTEAAQALPTTLDDAWEDAPTSGFFVFELLHELPFAEAWDAYSRGEWPVVEGSAPQFRFRRQGPWQRALAVHLVHRFLSQRIVDLPRSIKTSELDKPLRALVLNLQSFEEAIAGGMVPEVIEGLLEVGDAAIVKLARAWTSRHDAWRASSGKGKATITHDEDDFDDMSSASDEDVDAALAAVVAKVLGKTRGAKSQAAADDASPAKAKRPAKGEEAPAAEAPAPENVDTPFLRSLRAALSVALDKMIEEELIDLNPDRKPALLAELVEAGANARTAQHLLKSLTDALVNSELVEEIYATDEEVGRFIRARLETR